MKVCHIYLSPEHNYFGHHDQEPGTAPMVEVTEATLVAGQGIEGDRFFGFKTNYKGQVTFFSQDVHEALCEEFGVRNQPPSVYRRNVIVSGVDLNTLIGTEFTVQGVRFAGVCECAPCYWMDQAFHPGAEKALKGRGGLRARVLTAGVLRQE